jgi:two-component system invasion response regulator UvrY
MSTSIRVGIADDHSITRTALRRFLAEQEDMVMAGEAWDGRSAIDLVRRAKMDVLLLDLMMPGKGGLEALPMIRAKSPETGILVLSSCPEEHYAVNSIRLGASGYLNKQCEPEEIIDAVRVVATGRRYLSATVAELMASRLTGGSSMRHPHEYLTDREFQLLVRFARGFGSTETAELLSLSPKTVSTYRTVILNKLGLKTNSEMTHYAMVHGLID